MANINRVIITGNLTRDPEMSSTGGGTEVCRLGVAVNQRRKDQSGNWIDEPNFFDVTVFGAQGANCATYLRKGRPVAIDGRLRWSSWEAKDGSGKRSKVDIVAQTVQFLGSREDGGQGGPPPQAAAPAEGGFSGGSDAPADTSDFADPVGAGGGTGADDDIPF